MQCNYQKIKIIKKYNLELLLIYLTKKISSFKFFIAIFEKKDCVFKKMK